MNASDFDQVAAPARATAEGFRRGFEAIATSVASAAEATAQLRQTVEALGLRLPRQRTIVVTSSDGVTREVRR